MIWIAESAGDGNADTQQRCPSYCSVMQLLTELVVEVEVEAPDNSSRHRPAGKSPRTGAFSKFHPQTSPLSSRMSCFSRSPGIPSAGKSEFQVFHMAESSAFLPPPAIDVSSVSGDAEPVGCDQVAASGVSLFDELGPYSAPGEIVLEDLNSFSPGVWVADQIQGSLQSVVSLHDRPQASDAEFSIVVGLSVAGGCNRLLPVSDPKICSQQSLLASQNLSPAMDLDEAPLLKVVRFAPEILSAMAPSCAPHRRKLAPCSDVCHPSKFRSSKMGNLASEVAPVADGPNLAPLPFAPPREALGVASPDVDLSMIDILLDSSVDIVNHDLMVPLLDGLAAIDPDLTPSPISRISRKYSLTVSTSGELISSISNGSLDRAKKKARTDLEVHMHFCMDCLIFALSNDSDGFCPRELLAVLFWMRLSLCVQLLAPEMIWLREFARKDLLGQLCFSTLLLILEIGCMGGILGWPLLVSL
ncbi:hypothetical protein Nepgr_019576 [Nepenthes gracilis]|uniref:Uncharacterized protein n=1 Tax=Nepenthes gracilis TaxID=150966 RepID=A0AAD3STT7_NEPGR|nr:hypothetical protein Nepgr_019576 [Nepenthes gracilis]